MGIFWELDENRRILMGTIWEIKPQPLQKDKKHPLGACLRHPTVSPLQKIRNIGAPHMHYLNLCFLGTSY
jgi:hypothetical protein